MWIQAFVVIIFVILMFLMLQIKRKVTQEKYIRYLRSVEKQIRNLIVPKREFRVKNKQINAPVDSVEDYRSYLKNLENTETAALTECLIAEYYYSKANTDKNAINVLRKNFESFIEEYPWASPTSMLMYKLANLFYFDLSFYHDALLTYRELFFKYPKSKWDDVIRTRIALLENNTDYEYEPLKIYIEGEILYKSEQFLEAIEKKREMIKRYPECNLAPQAQYEIADTFIYRLNSSSKAIEEFQKLVANYSHSQYAEKGLYRVAECHREWKRLAEAAEKYQEFILKYPQSRVADYACYYLGHCYEQLQLMDKAQEAYQKLVEHYQKSIWARVVTAKLKTLSAKKNEPGDTEMGVV